MLTPACTGDPECPAGTRKAGTACQKLDPVEVGPDAAMTPALDAGGDAYGDASAAEEDADADVAHCYLDYDHDGFGAGEPVPCMQTGDAGTQFDGGAIRPSDAGQAQDAGESADAGDADDVQPPAVVATAGDCDDDDGARYPGHIEQCDGRDNDCDADLDEGALNACGGACVAPFEHQLGEHCDNAQSGACAREGTYVCEGDAAMVCTAQRVEPSPEVCGDDLDNDCDGATNESDAINIKTWFKDCDGDGYSPSVAGTKSCVKPANVGTCTWTDKQPNPTGHSNWDCDDTRGSYKPGVSYGFPPSGGTNWDLNCDGVMSPGPAPAHVCSARFVGLLNGGTLSCKDDPEMGCFAWKGTDGKYRTTPTQKCPDPEAYQIRVNVLSVNGGAVYLCNPVAQSPRWPCK